MHFGNLIKKSSLVTVIFFTLLPLSFLRAYGEDKYIELTKFYNFESPYSIEKWQPQMMIGHRSNVAVSATDNLLGLDGGVNVLLGVNVGLPYNTTLGLSRSSTRKIYNLHAKFNFAEFFKLNSPINQAFITSLSIPRSDGYEKDLKYNFQLLNSKLFFNKLELLLPIFFTLFSNDLLDTSLSSDEHTFSAGLGARYKLYDELFSTFEFAYPIWGYKNFTHYYNEDEWLPFFSFALQYQPTYGHILSLGISNANGMAQEEFIGGGNKDIRVGLTISVLF